MNNTQFTKKYYIKRDAISSIKWSKGKKEKSLPMWIADMDFKCDEKVINNLNKFISKGDFGYTNLPEDYYKVLNNWHQTRNNITYKQEWIRFASGAVNAMYQIINSFTKEKDHILINTPLYPPFKNTILSTKRNVVESKLINNNGYFTFDFKDIENKIKNKKVKMLMLCSPHNPIGRVWKKKELETLFALCKKYNVLICSDEVHSDIIMPNNKFIPSLAFKKYHDILISIVAASKTFSLAVFSHSHIIIPDDKLRTKLINYQQLNCLNHVNVMNALPTYFCYKDAGKWLDAMIEVIYENYQYLVDNLSAYFQMSKMEGSYLVFVNIGKYNTDSSASQCLIDNCHILTNPGESFDKQYNNWVRINLATSLDNVKIACDRLLRFISKNQRKI